MAAPGGRRRVASAFRRKNHRDLRIHRDVEIRHDVQLRTLLPRHQVAVAKLDRPVDGDSARRRSGSRTRSGTASAGTARRTGRRARNRSAPHRGAASSTAWTMASRAGSSPRPGQLTAAVQRAAAGAERAVEAAQRRAAKLRAAARRGRAARVTFTAWLGVTTPSSASASRRTPAAIASASWNCRSFCARRKSISYTAVASPIMRAETAAQRARRAKARRRAARRRRRPARTCRRRSRIDDALLDGLERGRAAPVQVRRP